MTTLFLDLETYCATPIQNGTHAYAEDAEIMLWAYALDDGEVKVWDCTVEPLMPNDLNDALEDETIELVAHNTGFDRTVLWHNGYRFPLSRWRDTMVKAMAHSMPGALGTLCDILGVPADQAKSKRGKELVQLFCKPRPSTAKIARATRDTHPAEWVEFVAYAGSDISAMRYIDKKLPSWNYKDAELRLWQLDQVINDRGFCVDLDLARAAIRAVDRAQGKLADRTQEITEYDAEAGTGVRSATQRDALLKFLLEEHGVELPDMKASTLERRINDENLPPMLRELLAIRLQASTSSTSKYKTLLKAVSSDHRLRGSLQFCGATRTGRYAGRLFQPHNMPRPSLKSKVIEEGIRLMKLDAEDLFFTDVMQLTSSAIRGCIVAPEGKKLCVADLSNIEGRILAWLVGETWKLAAFKQYDTFVTDADGVVELDAKGEPKRVGHDLYVLAYAKSFGVSPADVGSEERQVGKVQELALGYQGGVGAFLTFALAYNLDLEQMADDAYDSIAADVIEEAEGFMKWLQKSAEKQHAKRVADGMDRKASEEMLRQACQKVRYGLSEKAFVVCDSFKRMWRQAHPETEAWWHELEDAARVAISQPNKVVTCRRVKLIRTGAWLRIVLPSGRALCYPSPQISEKNEISYMGINQYSRKWSRIKTYGGKLAENITQAVARDVLVDPMHKLEEQGYQIVLSVHDELLTETPDTEAFSAEGLASMMATNPVWAQGLPLAAAGFEAYRYRKG